MEIGSLSERRLNNAVFREIRKNSKSMQMGAGIGNDYSDIDGIIVSDGTGSTPDIAWAKATNNFACSCADAVGARITLLLPTGVRELYIRQCMAELQELAKRDGIQIAGGNTQVSDAVSEPVITVHIFGHAVSKQDENTGYVWKADKRAIRDGDGIIMCGYAGMLGTDALILKNAELIKKRFGNAFSAKNVFGSVGYSVTAAVRIIRRLIIDSAAENNVSLQISYMHDVSYGGVYSALWQLGGFADCGFKVNNSSIPVRQETIEVCEALDKNPYLIDGSGGLLVICNDAETVLRVLNENGIVASMIGRICSKGERQVIFGDNECRTLSAPSGDEIYAFVW